MRTQALFNGGWLFHEGDITVPETARKSPLYIEAKTECKRCGPAARDYLDWREYYCERGLISHETWTRVDLPHDYVISQEPRRETTTRHWATSNTKTPGTASTSPWKPPKGISASWSILKAWAFTRPSTSTAAACCTTTAATTPSRWICPT